MKNLLLLLIISLFILSTTNLVKAGEIVFRRGPRSVIVCYPTVYYNTYKGYPAGYSSGYGAGYYYGSYYSTPSHCPSRRDRISRRNRIRRNSCNYSYYPVKSSVDLDRVYEDRYYIY